jgi:hypothetical protein
MTKTTERNFSDSLILSRSHEVLRLERRLNEEKHANRENPFRLDDLLDSKLSSDSNFLLDSDDSFDLDDLDPFDLSISDLRWDDDQPQLHS